MLHLWAKMDVFALDFTDKPQEYQKLILQFSGE